MKRVVTTVILILVVITMWWISISVESKIIQKQNVDCSQVSFHPDYTTKIREACKQRLLK